MNKEKCQKCGTEMNCEPDVFFDIYTCPSCGWKTFSEDYEDDDEDDEAEWESTFSKAYNGNPPPKCCRACGGPYPNCVASCKLFDA